MTQSVDESKRVLETLTAHQDELVDHIHQGLRERLFDSRAFIRPADLKRIAALEAEAFFAFLQDPDEAKAEERGVHLSEVGLGEQAALTLGRILRRWCWSHLEGEDLEQVLEIADSYHSALVQAFIHKQQEEILEEQERIRSALQRTVGRRTLHMEVASDIARVAASTLDLNELLETSVDLIRERLDFYYVGVFLVDEYDEWAVLRAGTGEPGQEMLRAGHKLKIGGESMIGWCTAHGEPRIAHDVGSEVVRFDNPLLPETRSEIALPLTLRGDIIGAMTIQSDQRDAFGEEDIATLQTVADQLVSAIENARLFAESQARANELEAAYRRSLREEWAEFQSGQEAGGHVGYAYDLSRATTRPADDVWTSEMERAVNEGSVVALNAGDEPGNGQDSWLETENGAALAAPINLRGENIGALGLYELEQERQWTEDDIALVEAVSAQAALALENARLFQETKEMAQRRALINEVLQAASTSLKPDDLLHRAAEAVSGRLHIPSVVFMLDGGVLRFVAAHDDEAEDVAWSGEEIVAPEMDPTLFEAVKTKEVRRLDAIDGRLRGPAADLADRLGIEASLYAPLISRGKVLGVLQMGRLADQPPLAAEDVTFAEIIAGNLSVGLESARLYQEAVDTAERLREVDRLKSQFLANMSHELRTPLNSIIGFSRVILKGIDGPITDQQREDLEAIHNSGQHLLGLINDILDISKIEAGKMELSFGQVDMEDIIDGVMSTAIALVKGKPVDLQQAVPDELPTIKADERRVRQVLLNLVSNAAKFTEEGFIRVEAELDDEEEEVIVSVADTGTGIPQEKIEEIFQPFTQVDGSSTRKHGGTGLGLAITNSFVEMHGGELWVESKVGEGSTFYFSLPIEGPSAPEEEAEESVEEEKPDLEPDLDEGGKLVLCVDDDEGVLTLFRRYLRKQGYQIVGLTDATRVLQEAKRLRPYAITLDVMMPEKDGWQVIRELKSDPETRDIPVIVCSIVTDQEKGISLGAADYLVKPIVEDDLIAALDRLDREEGTHRVLIVDDHAEDRDLLRRMIEGQEGYEVTEASGGREAIELIKRAPPHIIVLDLMMPEVDGFAVLEAVKSDQATRHIPVVVVTAKELTEEEHRVLNHRIESLIQKGVLEQRDLLEDVVAALRKVGD